MIRAVLHSGKIARIRVTCDRCTVSVWLAATSQDLVHAVAAARDALQAAGWCTRPDWACPACVRLAAVAALDVLRAYREQRADLARAGVR